MTATWVLVVLLNAGDAGFTADFYTKSHCEAAGQAVIANVANSYHSKHYICVEK